MSPYVKLANAEDIDRLNEIANHPDVLPYISDGDALNFAISPPTIITFLSAHGAIFFIPHGAAWEFHTLFLPEGRGRHALKVAKETARLMFDRFGAKALVTYSPDDYPHTKPPRSFGFKEVGWTDNYIRGVGASFWQLTREDWRIKQCQQHQS